MNRTFKTLLVTSIYCIIWYLLEVILYGQAENRDVDNIMMVLFIPIIYRAVGD